MPLMTRGEVRIAWEEHGDPNGFPVLALAPGGLRSTASRWPTAPWNPLTSLPDHRVIAMDQRNAGRSSAPITARDGWHSYLGDQLALLDHLGIERCHVVGMCIGGPFVLGLLRADPDRFAAAVLLQPIGVDGHRDAFYALFDGWRDEVGAAHPEADDAAWTAFREAMFGGEDFFDTRREQLPAVSHPAVVAMGSDVYHPASVSRAVAAGMPGAVVLDQWKAPAVRKQVAALLAGFLAAHR